MQKKEIRLWCQNKYGKDWWNVDPVIKKARLEEAKKALDKPYVKKLSMKAGNGAKLCANKGIDEMKPVYYMRNNDAEDEENQEEWIAEVPPLVAVTNEFSKYVFDETNKVKFEGNKANIASLPTSLSRSKPPEKVRTLPLHMPPSTLPQLSVRTEH